MVTALGRTIWHRCVMGTTSSLGKRLANGEFILIDGATGTDIERRGVPMVEHAWCGVSALTHGDDVRAVHRAHIDAGAELIIANTYASSRHLLAWANMEDHFEEINRRAVQLAIEARDQAGRADVLIAGSMSTSRQGGPFPDLEVARANFAEQGRILAAAGADIIALEMMRDITQTEVCLEGALATGLPVWMGISCVINDGVPWMWEDTITLEAFMERFADEPLEAISIMHTETEDVDACLDVVKKYWHGPLGVYAQSGIFEHPKWVFIDVISAQDYADACMRWIDNGVQIIGGCCGIGHEHISHLRPLIK